MVSADGHSCRALAQADPFNFAGSFSGDVKATESVSTIIGHQYASISRGKDSIFGMIQAAGYNPSDYIAFYNLRQYDRSGSCVLALRGNSIC